MGDSGDHMFSPLHPNISMYILHTIHKTFPKVVQGEFV